MGKKRVVDKTTEDILKEEEKIEAAQRKAQAKGVKKVLKSGRAYINASYNNTKITITDREGRTIAWASAGAVGFKGPKKATPYAASRVVEILAEKIALMTSAAMTASSIELTAFSL